MNNVVLTGRLVANPELKQTQSGKSVCSFRIAVDRRFKSEGQPSADFINCVAWNKTAEFLCKYFERGKMLALSGNIQVRTWEDQGKKNYVTEVMVENIEFCGSKSDSNGSASSTVSNDKNNFQAAEEVDDDMLPF